MGMFDDVGCRYRLPHHQDATFQTKDLAAVALGERCLDGLLDEYPSPRTAGYAATCTSGSGSRTRAAVPRLPAVRRRLVGRRAGRARRHRDLRAEPATDSTDEAVAGATR